MNKLEEEKKEEEEKKKEEEKKEEEKKKEEEIKKEKEKEKEIKTEEEKKILAISQNNEILKNINHSLETTNKLQMSGLKFPSSPNEYNSKIHNIENQKNEEIKNIPKLNYPLSAIGLLKSDFGKGYFLYGTATLIAPEIILTCAHNIYSPVLKKKAEYITFYMDLTNGVYLKESQVETFVYPDEYEYENKENFDFAICLLKQNLGLIGGYLGLCPYDKEKNSNGFFYGYVNNKIDNYYESFRCELGDYNIKGRNLELRLDSKEEFLLYLNGNTFNGQDGSPIFKIKDNDISFFPSLPLTDIQIFALDCSFTKMQLLYLNKNKFKNSYITNDKIVYDRTNRAIPITNSIYNQILRWIHFYTVVKPKGLDDNLKMSYTSVKSEGKDTLLKTNILEMSNSEIIGKDMTMILNSYDLSLIRILDLSNNEINYEGIKMLIKHKKMCENLIELNLAENELGFKSCEELIKIDYKTLNKLDLSLNEIGSEGCKILSKGNFSTVIDFNLSRNDICEKGVKYIVNGNFKNVEIFNLEGNRIDDDGAYELIKGNMKKLIELNIASNKIGDDGIILFTKCNYQKLKKLNISWNDISPIGIDAIINGIFGSLEKLICDYNKLGVVGAYYIAQKPYISIKELSIVHNDICTKGAEMIGTLNLNFLEYLNVSDNYICDLGLYYICNGNLNNLKRLNVSLNQITKSGVEYLGKANFNNNLTELNIEGNNIEDVGFKYIVYSRLKKISNLNVGLNLISAKSIYNLSSGLLHLINRLNLERNNIGKEGMSYLMQSNFISNMIELNVSYNNIEDEGCLYLSNGSLINLEILNLKNNHITNIGIQHMAKCPWSNLIDLNLEDNEISTDGFKILASGFITNLKFLKVKGNNLTDNDIKILQNGNLGSLDKEMGLTFINYSKVSNSVIRFCLRHPDRRYYNKNYYQIS